MHKTMIKEFSFEYADARSLMVQGRFGYNFLINYQQSADDTIQKVIEASEIHDFLSNKSQIEEANKELIEFVFPGYTLFRMMKSLSGQPIGNLSITL